MPRCLWARGEPRIHGLSRGPLQPVPMWRLSSGLWQKPRFAGPAAVCPNATPPPNHRRLGFVLAGRPRGGAHLWQLPWRGSPGRPGCHLLLLWLPTPRFNSRSSSCLEALAVFHLPVDRHAEVPQALGHSVHSSLSSFSDWLVGEGCECCCAAHEGCRHDLPDVLVSANLQHHLTYEPSVSLSDSVHWGTVWWWTLGFHPSRAPFPTKHYFQCRSGWVRLREHHRNLNPSTYAAGTSHFSRSYPARTLQVFPDFGESRLSLEVPVT